MKEAPYAWVVVWATFFALAIIFGVSYSFAAFFASFAGEFDAHRADVSLVFGLSGGVYFVFGAGAGMLADRFGPRAVACSGMLLIAAGLLLCSFAGSMFTVYVAYGVGVGLGIALVYTPSIACVQPWFTQRRGLAAGLASAGIGAGTVAVPLIATAAIAALQWREAMRAIAAGVLVLGLCATWLLRRAPVAIAAGGGQIPGLSLREALRDGRFWWLYLSVVLAAPSMFIPFAHVSAAARDMGIDATSAVGLVGLIGIGSLVGRFVIGALADRLGRMLTLLLMQASMGLSLLAWFAAGGYPMLVVFALWFGLSYGGIVSLLPAISMDLFGARAVAGIIGTLYSGAALGNLLGPVLAGWVFDHAGTYVPVLWACMGLSALAAAASARLLASRTAAY
ncbi:MAG: MFS transporter [Burkholderiaceae bacterium]|jgi:MFS family permease|nr:MFS transporter [Burkholderiaceae bacterium]MCU0964115.1 MFS transporter [Burkholderiaceae bacterium]